MFFYYSAGSNAHLKPKYIVAKKPEVKQIDDFWYKKQKIKDKAIEKLKGNEHVHLPNSSWYPILLAASVLFLPIGLLIYSATEAQRILFC